MKIETAFGTLKTDKHDTQLVSAFENTVQSVTELADVFSPKDGECANCGENEALRPFPLTVDGELTASKLCATCQNTFVANALDGSANVTETDVTVNVSDAD